MIETQQKQIG